MNGIKGHRHHRCRPYGEGPAAGVRPYWGWSHQSQRMEFMDLPTYMASIQHGYDAAYGDLTARLQQMGWTPPGPAATAPAPPGQNWQAYSREHHRGDWHRHDHGDEHFCECEERDDGDCEGCGHHHRHRDCRCDCCIVDADIVVYARCGEVRVIPIEIANDTRRTREDVEIDVSEVRTSAGKVLPWATILRPGGPLRLEPCSTTKLELGVHIVCGERRAEPQPPKPAKGDEPTREMVSRVMDLRQELPDVERCEVGYVTIRLGGCLVRPIVVAVAVQPLDCDAYRAGCSCSCCC